MLSHWIKEIKKKEKERKEEKRKILENNQRNNICRNMRFCEELMWTNNYLYNFQWYLLVLVNKQEC